ncbi:non-homologous end-joining DNA ligase [Amycolatopsis sp. WQ 127309]|uniref:non-homologous end-joining DNA ligase n=1 Tax=Amycolatopsis sp. WQ 127309 TaxID=2932773 RepID=UPI001FF4CB83|nr:non-homologous end-joining DNA ligase [Amycolatopsis sp. WQ 127309]UOZ04820.1 non-homologous end-joining DNA ligase [Amycolatopsis sp. WQ 127309]
MDPDEITTSNPDKIFYPEAGLTKGDVVAHYRTVAEVMVPHLRGRPLTLRRYPNGIAGQTWYQKEASPKLPSWIRVEAIPQRATSDVRHVICDDPETLVYLANQAAIEFHVWSSTVDDLEHPDTVLIDIDPPGDVTVADLRAIARLVKKVYEAAGLTAYLQATGGRGFHVVAPIEPSGTYDEVRELAKAAAEVLVRLDPDRLTTAVRKAQRGDRVYLDILRNGYTSTFVAPYSLRARPSAGVATPIDWRELGKAEPAGWTPKRIKDRLARKGDPWAGMADHAASPVKALKLLEKL